MKKPLRDQKIYTYLITIPCGFIVGIPIWLAYRWCPDLMPFIIGWIIIHPLYKIAREIEMV